MADSDASLIPEVGKLAALAHHASERSYSPYSGFAVEAAVLLENGNVYPGCNVENAAYGPTICAERAAIFQAVSREGPEMRIRGVVVYTPTEHRYHRAAHVARSSTSSARKQ